VTNDAHIGGLAFVRTLNVLDKSAKCEVVVPFGSLFAKALVSGIISNI
jgi:hypothetical protein